MSFANPILLVGLFAMAIPPLVQFFARRRYDEVHWGAMQFLRLSPRARRKLHLEEWLLLAIRMLVLGLLATALAGPSLRSRLFADAETRRPRVTVLLLDCSASMNRIHQGKTATQVMKELAIGIFNQVRPEDRVAVFAVTGEVIPVASSLTSDVESVRASLELLPHPGGTADWPAAVERATRLLSDVTEEAEIVVISDGQRFGWSDGETLARWDFLDRIMAAKSKTVPRIWMLNAAAGWPAEMGQPVLGTLRSNRTLATANAAVEFDCPIRRHPAKDVLAARLEIDGRAAGELSTTVESFHFSRRLAPGSHLVTLKLGADRRDFAFEVVPSIPVLIVEGKPECGRFIRDALAPARDPAPAFAARSVPWTKFALTPEARVVVFANVPKLSREQSASVERWLASGGGVLVAPGEDTEAGAWNTVHWLPTRLVEIAGSESAVDSAPRPDIKTLDHPTVRVFQKPWPGGLQTAYFPRYWRLEPDALSTVLGRLTNGDPFLVGRGRAILAAVPLDNSWRTNLVALPDYVRLIHELAYDLAAARESLNLNPGEVFVDRSRPEETSITIHKPDDRSMTIPVRAGRVIFEGTHAVGAYKVIAAGRTRYFTVQTDLREFDLTPMSEAERAMSPHLLEKVEMVELTEFGQRRGRGAISRDFTEVLLLSVLALLAAELWQTRRLAVRGT